MGEYRYSVIIPHKNCPELLERCLKSIPNRLDVQIIVVDDNSDNIERVNEVKEKLIVPNLEVVYSRVNKGAGAARNLGLKLAKGKWLVFADADDYFSDTAFQIFDEYFDSDNDIVYFHHLSVYSDTLESCFRFNERNERIDSYLNSYSDSASIILRYKDAVPWSKLFRHSIVEENNILFDEVPASNDVMFAAQCGNVAVKISADSRSTYVVTYRRGSLTSTPSLENLRSRYEVMLRYNLYVSKAGHSEVQGRPLSAVIKAFRLFGTSEGIFYIKLAKRYGVSLFTGYKTLHKSIFSHFRSLFDKNYHKF